MEEAFPRLLEVQRELRGVTVLIFIGIAGGGLVPWVHAARPLVRGGDKALGLKLLADAVAHGLSAIQRRDDCKRRAKHLLFVTPVGANRA